MEDGKWVSTSTPYLAAQGGDAWGQDAADQGGRGTQRIVFAGETTAPANVASMLGLREGAPVIARRRVMHLDGLPVELTDSHYPVGFAQGTPLAEPRKIPGGAVKLLAEMGLVGADVQEEVTARPSTRDEQEALQLADGEWVLTLARLTRTSDGSPVEASVMTMPARQRKLRYRLKA